MIMTMKHAADNFVQYEKRIADAVTRCADAGTESVSYE